jgi:hypothetical protein
MCDQQHRRRPQPQDRVLELLEGAIAVVSACSERIAAV